MTAGRISPSVALAAYAESWISGMKVVVIGDASSALPERLLERGARQVQVYDSDPVRVAEAIASSKNRLIGFAALDQAGSPRDGAFDFGIIEDLSTAGSNAPDWLSRLRRSISRRGLGLIASQNSEVERRLVTAPAAKPKPLGYYELYDAISQHWAEVRMLGQTPFVGYAIADFSAADEPEIRIDTAFVPGGAEEPEWFLALVSALPTQPEAFSVIQLPFGELETPVRQLVEELESPAATAAATAAAARAVALEAELEALRAKVSRESASRESASRESASRESASRDGVKKLDAEVVALRAELAKREEWLKGLESRAATADQRADEMQAELDQKRVAAAEAKRELARLTARIEEEERGKRNLQESARGIEQELAKTKRLEQELAKTKQGGESQARRFEQLEAELRSLRQGNETLSRELQASKKRPEPDEDAQAELRQLESLLGERAKEVTRLTDALHQTERFGRQLIIELEQLKAAAQADAASRELGRLAQRNAELEADLEAARWTISSLEANLPEAPTAPAAAVPGAWRDGALPV